jgi:L-lactate dehydrogenase complex protein LldE
MRVGLFVTCLVDMMRPEIGFAALDLLQAAGCEVVVPPAQTCCGQPAFNAGERHAVRTLAERFLQQFDGFDYVVLPSGSCAGMVRVHYAEVFASDAAMLARWQALAPRVFELSEFLQRFAPDLALPLHGGRYSNATSSTPSNAARLSHITYHDSCSGLRELGIAAQPRALLAKIDGLTLTEMPDCRACCGFGGTFSIKFGAISAAIADEKCANIAASGAEAVVLGDLGCMLHIEGRLRRRGDMHTRVLHVAQVLAGGAGEGESCK